MWWRVLVLSVLVVVGCSGCFGAGLGAFADGFTGTYLATQGVYVPPPVYTRPLSCTTSCYFNTCYTNCY